MSVTIVLDKLVLRALISNTGASVERTVADGVNYGIHLEYGTSKMAAQPSARPALEAVRPAFARAFQNQLTDAQVESVVVKTAFDVERGWKERAPVDTGAYKNSIHVVEQ